jgi:hypothetical protein
MLHRDLLTLQRVNGSSCSTPNALNATLSRQHSDKIVERRKEKHGPFGIEQPSRLKDLGAQGCLDQQEMTCERAVSFLIPAKPGDLLTHKRSVKT